MNGYVQNPVFGRSIGACLWMDVLEPDRIKPYIYCLEEKQFGFRLIGKHACLTQIA